MNTIRTKKRLSIYEIYDIPYDEIYIDNIALDDFVDMKNPGKNIKGLVPTTSGWFSDEKDEELLWSRIIPENNKKTICPILICPDDQDYFCTTIVVEIENRDNKIVWMRLGFNKKFEYRKYEMIGVEVEWFQENSVIEFEYKEYEDVIRKIRANRISEIKNSIRSNQTNQS